MTRKKWKSSYSSTIAEPCTRYLCRYAHESDTVPEGWECKPFYGHHGANGYVLWIREEDNDDI